jgi:D-alanine transaminase
MPDIVFVNGNYVAKEDAVISIFDRGFLMSDAVYEVASVIGGKLLDNDAHLARLDRSLGELSIKWPMSKEDLVGHMMELVTRNDLDEGLVYLQVTRGVASRDFSLPDVEPTLVMFTMVKSILSSPVADKGIKVITTPDIRWQRRDIKTTSLLAASMARQTALDAGADDAWLVEDGHITEGSSNNAFIVTTDGVLVSPSLAQGMLHGITRRAVLGLAKQEGLKIEERTFTPEEAYQAAEAFSTSASSIVMPVVQIDDHIMSNGAPGPIANKLRKLYLDMAVEQGGVADVQQVL